MYAAGEVSPEEYIEILQASGWSTPDAYQALLKTHREDAPAHWETPTPPPETIDWGMIGKPGRKPTRYPQNDNATTGHPLEE